MSKTREEHSPPPVSYFNAVTKIRTQAPVLFSVIGFWLCLELFAIFLLPLLLPQTQYLSWYLSDTAKKNFVEFLDGKAPFLEYDPNSGWRNRPGASFGQWSVAADGSRPTTRTPSDLTPAAQSKSVMLLGSSLVNGGTHVSNEETISSYLESDDLRVSNFGTMLYSADQSILSYRSRLHTLKPNIIVLGLSSDPGAGLSNRYVPFRFPAEENMPYFKPRFIQENNELKLLQPLPLGAQRQLLEHDSELTLLEMNDSYFSRFSGFRYFEQLPLASSAYYLYRKASSLKSKTESQAPNAALLMSLLKNFEQELSTKDIRLVLMLLPGRDDIEGGRIRTLFPNRFDSAVGSLQREKFEILNVKDILKSSSHPLSSLYYTDGSHFSARGNGVIAEALREKIRN